MNFANSGVRIDCPAVYIPIRAIKPQAQPLSPPEFRILKELFVNFMSIGCRKCYNIDNISKILCRIGSK